MAIKFEKIKAGMTLYDIRKATGLQRFNSKWSTWSVKVLEVDAEKRMIFASWNCNAATWIPEGRATKFCEHRRMMER